MSRGFVYLLLGIIGAIATVIFLQNLDVRITIKFLGVSSFPLPVGLSMLLFFGVGAISAIPFNWLLTSPQGGHKKTAVYEPEVIDVDYID